MEAIIDNRQDFMNIDDGLLDKIKDVISECLSYESYSDDYEVSLSFVTNEEIRQLNKEFRGVDKVTDVLSFPLLTDEEFDFDIEYEEESLGDIVISMERAKEQADDYGHSLEREVCFLVCHSMFHLLGYDHIENEDAKDMHSREEAVLNKLAITRDI